jgi:hypothetical protein
MRFNMVAIFLSALMALAAATPIAEPEPEPGTGLSQCLKSPNCHIIKRDE